MLNKNLMMYCLVISISMINGCTTAKPIYKKSLQEGEKYNYFKNSSSESEYSSDSKDDIIDIYKENRGKPESIHPGWQPKGAPVHKP